MSVQRIGDRFPAFYRKFLPRFFEAETPRENVATCSNCAMLQAPHGDAPLSFNFSHATKCCTHYPILPNYIIGALLSDEDPALEEGRKRTRQIIRKRVGISPHGVLIPARIEMLLRSSNESFGRASSLVCPWFDSGLGVCTIWPFHYAVCNTWFCKHNSGEDGRLFWIALKDYMLQIEMVLVFFSLNELGFGPETILKQKKSKPPLALEDIDDKPPDEKTYSQLWGTWAGREEECYKETYHAIGALNHPRFQNLTGIVERTLLSDLAKKYRALIKPELPTLLNRNPHLVIEKVGDDEYLIMSYSSFDPLQVSGRIYRILDFFDGKTATEAVCKKILIETKTRLSLSLLLSLHQLRVLIERK